MRHLPKLAVASLLALALGCPKPEADGERGGHEGDGGSALHVTIYPHSQAHGDTVPCTEGFCDNGSAGAMNLVWNDKGLNLKVEAPEGTILNFAGEPVMVHKSPQDATISTLRAKLADYPIAERYLRVDAFARSRMGPGGKSASSTVVLDLDFLRLQLLALEDKAAASDAGAPDAGGKHEKPKAGLLFEGETAETHNRHRLVYLFRRVPAAPKLIGASSAARWRDIDDVAYETASTGYGDACPQADAGLGALALAAPRPRTLHSEVTLYDRRTGKAGDHTSFDAKGTCADPDAEVTNDAAVEAWLKTKLAAH